MAEDKVKTSEDLYKKVQKLSKTYKSLRTPEFVRSGSIVLDALLGGGIPEGMFIEWAAENGCGKSTGALHISRSFCMQEKKVLYLDYEGGVNDSQIEGMGLSKVLYDPDTNPEGIFFLYEVQTYKDAEKILDEIMEDMDLVIIDSMTAMLTEKVKGSSAEDSLPGIDARVQATFLKKYKAEAVRKGTSWIIISQMRTKIAMGYGQVTKDQSSGGNALKHYVDIRLQSKKAYGGDLVREEATASGIQKVPFGAICTTWAEKNRYERPKIPLNISIIFGKGISNEFAYADWLSNNGNVKKSGSWFEIKVENETAKVQGMNNVVEWVSNHRDLVKNYIKSSGGYKLLLNSSDSVDIGDSNEKMSEAYDTDSDVVKDFDMIGDGDQDEFDSDDE